MYFDLTDEQQAIRSTAKEFLAARYKSERIRELADSETGFEQSDWDEMAELGWTGLALPEEWGGQGLGIVDLAVLFEEMGYALAPSPLLSNTIVGLALSLCGSDDQRERFLRPLAAGERRGVAGALGRRLAGDDRRVHDGGQGRRRRRRPRRRKGPRPRRRRRRLLPRRHRRRPPPPGRRRRRRGHGHRRNRRSTSPAASPRSASRASGSMPRDTLPGEGADYFAVFHRLCVALAAESTGIAQRTMEMAVEYAKDRKQFDRPIGAYQAVSHRCAQMLLETENSRSAVYGAAWAADAEPGGAAARRLDRQGLRLRRRLAGPRRLDPGPRRDRLHLGARPPLLPQARQAERGDVRRRQVAPRTGRRLGPRRRRRAGRRVAPPMGALRAAISVAAIGITVADLEAETKRAEAAGVECVWAPELFRSSVTQAAYLAGKTETIDVATGIAWAFTRSPFIVAISALDIDEMSGGPLPPRARLRGQTAQRDLAQRRVRETGAAPARGDRGDPADHAAGRQGRADPLRGRLLRHRHQGLDPARTRRRASRCRSTPPASRAGCAGWRATSPTG